MPHCLATSLAREGSREAIATTVPSSLGGVAGMTFSRPILAVLKMPQRILCMCGCSSRDGFEKVAVFASSATARHLYQMQSARDKSLAAFASQALALPPELSYWLVKSQ